MNGPSTILTQIYLDGLATGVASTLRTYATNGAELDNKDIEEVVQWFVGNVINDEGAMQIVQDKISARIEGQEESEPVDYRVKVFEHEHNGKLHDNDVDAGGDADANATS